MSLISFEIGIYLLYLPQFYQNVPGRNLTHIGLNLYNQSHVFKRDKIICVGKLG